MAVILGGFIGRDGLIQIDGRSGNLSLGSGGGRSSQDCLRIG